MNELFVMSETAAKDIVDYVLKLFIVTDPRIRYEIHLKSIPQIILTIPVSSSYVIRHEWDYALSFIGNEPFNIRENLSIFNVMKRLMTNSIVFNTFTPALKSLILGLGSIDTVNSIEELKLKLAIVGYTLND